MKILLIKSERLTETDRWVASPLGVLYLAQAARAAGHDARIMDLRVLRGDEVKPALDAAIAWKPDFVGFGAHSHQAATVRQVAGYIRKRLPDAFLAAGGPLATANTDYVLDQTTVDACVLGEGEETFAQLLAALSNGADWRVLPGLAHARDGLKTINPPAPPIDPLDRLPQPAWDLIDFKRYDKYLSISLRLGRRACVQTSRGCPYACIYCQHYFGNRFRGRTPAHVLEEIDILHYRYGIPRIGILDDIFNADRRRAESILEQIRDGYPGLKISFPNAVRGDLLDEPFIRLLSEARCEWMPIAVESGSPRVQKMIRKNLDFKKILEASKLLDRYGIASFACFMVGFPTETPAEREETFAMARRFKGQVPVFSLVTPYPGTALWDMAHPDGASANPETIDGAYGYRFHDDEAGALVERTLKISRKGFLQPRYWYVIRDELAWRLTSQWPILLMKILSMVAPMGWKRRLIRRINRRLDLCLE